MISGYSRYSLRHNSRGCRNKGKEKKKKKLPTFRRPIKPSGRQGSSEEMPSPPPPTLK